MYIKINGSDEQYDAYITTFKTQHSNDAIKIIGEVPQTDKGFKLYDDKDNLVNDLSDYIYPYGNDGNKYSNVEETIIDGESTFEPIPPSSYDRLSSRVSTLNNQVNAITPYTETKTVYIGDKNCIFTNIYKQGNISAYFTVDGIQMPCEVISEGNNIIVSFDEAEKIGTVTISIQ